MTTGAKPTTKEYRRPIPANWWLKRPAYLQFMIRELTSAFIAGYAVFLMVLMSRARDVTAFQDLFEKLKSPVSVVLHLIVLVFAMFHSITFFNLTPRVLRFFHGEEKVPDGTIAGGHYAAWLAVSVILMVIAILARG